MTWHRMLTVLTVLVVGCVLATQAACPAQPSCATNDDCSSAYVCVADEEEGLSVCAEPCAADLACAAGQACIARDDGSLEGACLEVLGEAASGEACEGDRSCLSGACVGVENPVCVEQCTTELRCDDETKRCVLDGVRRVCVPPTGDLPAGEPCADPRECSSGTCVDPPDPSEQEPSPPVCADNCRETIDCPRIGDACVRLLGGARACLEPLADGLPCQASSACAGGFCLEDLDGALKCASACVEGRCQDGFACVDDTEGNRVCMPQLDSRLAGEPCTTARQCASGHCAHFATPTEELGTLCANPCEDGGSCEGGLVCWEDDEGTDLCGPTPSA